MTETPATRLRDTRRALGLTQCDLGEALQIAQSMVSQIETEARRPSPELARAIERWTVEREVPVIPLDSWYR